MLKEAIQYVVDESRKSAGARVIRPKQEPPGVYLLQRPDGTVTREVAAPAPIKHTALDLSAVVEFAESYGEHSEIWYSREKVACVLDNTERRESVTLALDFSPQLIELRNLEKNPRSMDQRAIIYLLRTTFRRCLGRAGDLIGILRAVRFNTQAAGEGVVQHGKSSVGKTLQQEISGTAALPEYVVIEVPIFTNAALAQMFPVECALEPDASTQTFKIIPLPNEIERAISDGERMIAQSLGASIGEATWGAMHYGKP